MIQLTKKGPCDEAVGEEPARMLHVSKGQTVELLTVPTTAYV